jgi:methyl-accepting chemotaxis protein
LEEPRRGPSTGTAIQYDAHQAQLEHTHWEELTERSLVHKFRIDASSLADRQRFVRLDQGERELLAGLIPWARQVAPEIARAFYDWQFAFGPTRRFFEDYARQKGVTLQALRERLEQTQAQYFTEIFAGAAIGWDTRYFEKRLVVGSVHDRINLPFKWYVGAYAEYDRLLGEFLRRDFEDEAWIRRVESAVRKVFNLDLQAIGDSFILSTLQTMLGPIGLRLADITQSGDLTEQVGLIKQALSEQVSTFLNEMRHMAAEHDKGEIDVRLPAGRLQGALRTLAEGLNQMVESYIGLIQKAMACVAEFGRGNFDAPLERFPGKKAFINEVIEHVRSNLKALITDVERLIGAATEGKLGIRADAGKHQGDFRKIVEGFNNTLDNAIQPLNVAADYVERLSKGDIPPKITDNYHGDFNRIKESLNQLIEATNQVTEVAKNLSIGNTKVTIEKRSGSDQMVEAIQKMIANAQHDAWCVQQLAQGNLDIEIKVMSEHDVMAQSNVRLRDTLKHLVADTGMLAQAAAEGKLATRADAGKHQGEFRKIVEGINKTLDILIKPIQAVSEEARGLASSAEELTAVSQQMAGNAEETAAQANIVSAAGEQISGNVASVASAAEQMQASIREIAKNANESARVAKHAVSVAQSTNETVRKLGESSQEIGNVIKVITSIAQQTNLLALNATIEAARAGEAGKGFAVVANEVKELAKQTAKATEEISQKIQAIQADTHGAVKAIEEIGAIINQINDIANSIASALEEQTVTTNEIGRSVQEASKGVGEIAKNIAGVAVAAKGTSQGAADTQKAAQELSRMAARLQTVVSRFTF